MNDLDRIDHALETVSMDPHAFERFALDMLSTVYPGLNPIPGGTDWGRDGDVADGAVPGPPPRLLVTSARTLKGVRDNMHRGIKSLTEHGVQTDRLVLANAAVLNGLQRQTLARSASKKGLRLDVSDIFERTYFASRLRRDGYWRSKLLGLPSGPITLSRTAPGLAESPWSFLPLLAREGDKEALIRQGDLILTGPPGVGKSRLAGELDNVAFVDVEADIDQIASDLRWALPSALVVDDAADHGDLVGRLLRLRITEPDLFRYRLICVCWPEGLDELQALLPAARVHEVGLLERGPLNTVLQQMGITGSLARREILDQAEGRPGWAIALADLLLRSRDATTLLNGRALLGQVDRYMRRAGMGLEGMDILGLVAALGPIAETQLQRLATEAGVSRTKMAKVLTGAAHSGLVDVQLARDVLGDPARGYTVRPPMLADVLVADRSFNVPVPAFALGDLADRWPDRLVPLTRAAIEATRLGAGGARTVAERLLDAVLGEDPSFHADELDLSHRFLWLDQAAAATVVRRVRSRFDELSEAGELAGSDLEPLVTLAAAAVRAFAHPDAMTLLFDACLADRRPPNPNPAHPMRQISDLLTNFHPEAQRRYELRYTLASELLRWHARGPNGPERDQVAAEVLQALLSLRMSSAETDPGDPFTLQIVETVLPAEQMRRVFDALWSVAIKLLDRGNGDVAPVLLSVAEEWLRIGGGFDQPFGRSHPATEVAAASQIGQRLVAALAARSDLSLGERVRLHALATRHGLTTPLQVPEELEPFFRDVEWAGADPEGAEKTLAEDLQRAVHPWANDPPDDVIARLSELTRELRAARLMWPDRVAIALSELAKAVEVPLEWATLCRQHGLMHDGMPFVAEALRRGHITKAWATELVSDSQLRVGVLELLLITQEAPPWSTALAVDMMTAGDFRLVEVLVLRHQLSPHQITDLLTRPKAPIRATMALAVLVGNLGSGGWSPGDLESVWVSALDEPEPTSLELIPGYELSRALTYLVRQYPAVAAHVVEQVLVRSGGGTYSALPHEAWQVLHLLPSAMKTQLLRTLKVRGVDTHSVLEYLIGTDVEWLADLVVSGDVLAGEAAGCFRGVAGARPSTLQLAEALVPLGVRPEDIAASRFWGSWTGPASAHYAGLVEEFREMLASSSDAVRCVGEAGVSMFTVEVDRAVERERLGRIRGQR